MIPARDRLSVCGQTGWADGSSVGVHIISEFADWEPAIRDAACRTASGSLVELPRRERPRIHRRGARRRRRCRSWVIAARRVMYSYAAKYTPGGSTHRVPADIDTALAARMQQYGLVFIARWARAITPRTDVLLDDKGRTVRARVQYAARPDAIQFVPRSGGLPVIDYAALVDRLVKAASLAHCGGALIKPARESLRFVACSISTAR